MRQISNTHPVIEPCVSWDRPVFKAKSGGLCYLHGQVGSWEVQRNPRRDRNRRGEPDLLAVLYRLRELQSGPRGAGEGRGRPTRADVSTIFRSMVTHLLGMDRPRGILALEKRKLRLGTCQCIKTEFDLRKLASTTESNSNLICLWSPFLPIRM